MGGAQPVKNWLERCENLVFLVQHAFGAPMIDTRKVLALGRDIF